MELMSKMQDEGSRRCLFVEIDWIMREIFGHFKTHKTEASANAFLNALHKASPIRIKKPLPTTARSSRTACRQQRART